MNINDIKDPLHTAHRKQREIDDHDNDIIYNDNDVN